MMTKSALRVSACGLGLVAACGLTAAQPAVFPDFTVTTPNDSGGNTLQSLQLPTNVLEAGQTYTTYKVEFDWIPNPAGGFNARQWDAIWALTDGPIGPGTFVADPGPAINAQIGLVPQFQPGSLRWVGVFGNGGLSGSTPLEFNWLQSNAFTDTTWQDVRITMDTREIVSSSFGGDTTNAPTWTRFRDTREAAAEPPSTVQNIRYEAVPFFVETDGIYQFTTTTFSDWNGVIAIYQDDFDPSAPNDNRLDLWVGTAPGTPNLADRTIAFELEAGNQYFFLQTGRRSFDAGLWEGEVLGVGGVTFAIIPAPGAGALLGLAGLMASRRRR
ncbi:MAG: hypothetical protein EA378_08650 [Phycisphaerales bacterium]|nr:MAG: hypothetical protein EA378_08650 [Phycisphaerales bacterium]